MKIEGKEAVSFSRTLDQALKLGYQYVSVPDEKFNNYQRTEGVHFFKEKLEATNYSYIKRSKEGELVDTVPIQALKDQLDRKIELQRVANPNLKIVKDVLLDTSLIKFQEKARDEIFAEDIAKRLKAHNILPDIKALKKNIEEDKMSFQIDGIKSEMGIDKKYVIKIEQNEHRAFVLHSVEEKHRGVQQIKSDGLDISLLKEEVKDIQKMLRSEREGGNRFVAFPSSGVLQKEDFAVFKSAFDALQHAHDNSTDRDKYIVRSILATETEINKLLEVKKENSSSLKRDEDFPKKSRGQELSR